MTPTMTALWIVILASIAGACAGYAELCSYEQPPTWTDVRRKCVRHAAIGAAIGLTGIEIPYLKEKPGLIIAASMCYAMGLKVWDVLTNAFGKAS